MGKVAESADTIDLIEQNAQLSRRIVQLEQQVDRLKVNRTVTFSALRQGILDAATSHPLPDLAPVSKDGRDGKEEVAILDLSDWQAGKKTLTYNARVLEDRLSKVCAKTLQIVGLHRQATPVRTIHVRFMGDDVEGENIYRGQHYHIELPLLEQVIVSGNYKAALLRRFAAEFERVMVANVYGNHGELRGASGKNEYHPSTNADILSSERAYLLTRDLSNVHWQGGTKACPVNTNWYWLDSIKVNGKTWKSLIFHGHQARGGLEAVKRRVLNWLTTLQKFDSAHHGHFHSPQATLLNGVWVFSNGTTESGNDHALESMGASGRPTQWLTFTNGKRITAKYLLELD